MNDSGFITIKQLFAEVEGEYKNGTQLIDRLVEAHARHVTELPLIGIQELLSIGRDRGWIKSDEKRVLVIVPANDAA